LGACFFDYIFFAQFIIRANVPTHANKITEKPIKKYFTFIAPRIS